jgi:hypothetical protein
VLSLSPRGDLHTDIRAAPGPTEGGALFCGASIGYSISMTDDRIDQRAADLLPEERATGSADPTAQARAILADSDEREGDLEAAPDTVLEHRRSDQTVNPDETTR